MNQKTSFRIANIARRYVSDEWGGTETVIRNTSRCLVQSGCQIEILCTRALAHADAELMDGIQVRRFPYIYPYFPLSRENRLRLDKKGGNPFSWPLFNYLRKTPFDLLHCHAMARMAETVRLAAAWRNIPYVLSFHGGHYDVPPAEKVAMLKPVKHSLNYGKLLDLAIGAGHYQERAAGIICVGYNEFEIAARRFPGKLVEYIPNGVNAAYFGRKPELDFRKKYFIPSDCELILCVSRIDYQKNQLKLIELTAALLEKNKKVHTVIVGPVTADNYYREIKRAISAANLDSSFTIIEGLHNDSEELLAAYHAADIFILPSLHEPFGIVVLEAWAAGVPVMAARRGGLSKLVKDGETGMLFDPEDTADMYRAYCALSETRELRTRIKATAGDEVRRLYAWENIAGKLIDFYHRVKVNYEQKK